MLWFALLFPAVLLPQQSSLARSLVPLPQEVLERRFLDSDGDGRLDLWLAVKDDGGGRSLWVYLQRDGRVFPVEPDERIAVPRAVVAWSVGHYAPGAPAEVLFLARDAAMVRSAVDGSLRAFARAPMLLDMPAEDALPFWSHQADLDGDGLQELLLVQSEGYLVVDAAGEVRARIPLEPLTDRNPAAERAFLGGAVRASMSSQELSDVFVPNDDVGVIEQPKILFSSVRLPAPSWVDANGDGRLDLSYYFGGEIRIHLQDAQGHFATEPEARLAIPEDPDSDDSRLEWTDFGGGPSADLLLVRSAGGNAISFSSDWNLRIWTDPFTRILTDGKSTALGPPSVAVKTAAAYVGVYVLDLDGDGLRDLAVSAWDVDVSLVGDAATKLRHVASGWLQADGVIPARPAFSVTRGRPPR